MSLEGKRAEIAAAVTAVDGVKGYPTRPAAPRTGDAFPRWRGGAPDGGPTGLYMHEWALMVFLPPEEVAADRWVDDHLDALTEALISVGWVTGAAPVDLRQNEGSPVYGLMITMRSE